MSKRQIDMDYLLFAFEDESPDNAYYLDLDTGVVELVRKDLLDLDDLTDHIESDRERYLYIPKPDPKQVKKDLAKYTESLPDPGLKRLMLVALEAPDPLFSCQFLLGKTPGELASWKEYRQSKLKERINEWLKANFVLD